MSKPLGTSITSELSSAGSCLAMPAEKIPGEFPSDAFLCDTDVWAKHSLEHLGEAGKVAVKAHQALNKLEIMLLTVFSSLNDADENASQALDQLDEIRRMI